MVDTGGAAPLASSIYLYLQTISLNYVPVPTFDKEESELKISFQLDMLRR